MNRTALSLTIATVVSIQSVFAQSVTTRSVFIKPYPKEKIQELNQNIKSFNAPFQKFLSNMDALDKANTATEADPSPENNAALVQAAGDAMGAFASFVEAAQDSKPRIVYGLGDYADWLEMSAADIERRNGESEVHQNSAKWLTGQAKMMRDFKKDLEQMFTDVESVGQDLAVRAASWSQAYRVAKELKSLGGGPDGRQGVYKNMTRVIQTAKNLKKFLSTATGRLYAVGSSEKEAELKNEYREAVSSYHEEY